MAMPGAPEPDSVGDAQRYAAQQAHQQQSRQGASSQAQALPRASSASGTRPVLPQKRPFSCRPHAPDARALATADATNPADSKAGMQGGMLVCGVSVYKTSQATGRPGSALPGQRHPAPVKQTGRAGAEASQVQSVYAAFVPKLKPRTGAAQGHGQGGAKAAAAAAGGGRAQNGQPAAGALSRQGSCSAAWTDQLAAHAAAASAAGMRGSARRHLPQAQAGGRQGAQLPAGARPGAGARAGLPQTRLDGPHAQPPHPFLHAALHGHMDTIYSTGDDAEGEEAQGPGAARRMASCGGPRRGSVQASGLAEGMGLSPEPSYMSGMSGRSDSLADAWMHAYAHGRRMGSAAGSMASWTSGYTPAPPPHGHEHEQAEGGCEEGDAWSWMQEGHHNWPESPYG